MAIGDQVGKQAIDEVVAQLPQIEAFVDAQLTKIRDTVQQVVADAKAEIEMVVGQSLQTITVERTQAVNQVADTVHGILDRIQILPRKQ